MGFGVADLEVEPLGVAARVGVNTQEQIKLGGLHLDHAVQIAGLEATVEQELLLPVEGGVHAFEGPVEDG